jgi:hypothetical protein
MSDIVERLRAPAYWISGSSDGHEGDNSAPLEAAAEIERLRAALRNVLSYVPHGDMPVTIYDNARAALAQEKA